MVRPYDVSLSNANKEKLWYSSEELKEQRRNDLNIVSRIRQAASSSKVSQHAMVQVVQSLPDQGGWNVRGLEGSLDGGNQKCENKLRGMLAVLMEQDRQDMEDKEANDVKIAKRYIKATNRCQTVAYIRAIMDRAEVEKITSTKKESYTQRNVGLLNFLQPTAVRVSTHAA